jgi:gas vesicle protein GvpN
MKRRDDVSLAAALALERSVEEAAPPAPSLSDFISPRPALGKDVVSLEPRTDLFENEQLLTLEARALSYLRAGIPVHLRGPAGTGKTTTAMQIAAKVGRPAVLLTGDSQLTAANLIGREVGTKSKQVVDRYVHSVKKVETETSAVWSDEVLTQAFIEGYTLVYDEFTRSPPQANNPLLAAFEERILILPGGARKERYVRAHPEFRAILTSNPGDYAGVAAPQDALIDRMITLDLDDLSRDTEIGIVAKRSGLDPISCVPIVDLLCALRQSPQIEQRPSLRGAIMIARIIAAEGITPGAADPRYLQLCFDVLESKAPKGGRSSRQQFAKQLAALVRGTAEND